MIQDLLQHPASLLAVLALPLLLVVVPWRVGWVGTLVVLAWADSAMPAADLPRKIAVRAAVLVLLFAQGLVRLRGRGRGAPPPVPVLAFLALALVSTAWSETPVPTLGHAGLLTLVVVVAFSHVARHGASGPTATATMESAAVAMLALVALGLVPFGRGEPLFVAGRLRGFFSNANGLGITCALLAPWAVLRAARTTGVARAVAVAVVVGLAGLAFLSGSRTGFGGLVLGCSVTLFLRQPSRSLAVAIFCGVAIALASLAGGGDVDLEEGAVGQFARAETVSRLSGRLDRWQEGIERFEESPALGHGFKASWRYEAPDEADAQAGAVTASGTNYHSQHVETLVDLGAVGEVLFLAVLWSAWRRARAVARRRDDVVSARFGAAAAGTLAAAALDSFFHNWLLTAGSPYAFFVWSLVATTARLSGVVAPSGAPRPLAAPVAVPGVP